MQKGNLRVFTFLPYFNSFDTFNRNTKQYKNTFDEILDKEEVYRLEYISHLWRLFGRKESLEVMFS